MVRYVAGDIGGTNSRLQLIDVNDEGEETLIGEETYPSQQYSSLTFVIHKFLHTYNSGDAEWPSACCLAVAGPVQGNKSKITNVGWTLDGVEMSRELNIRSVLIINDFEGIGYGLLALSKDDIVPLNDVPVVEGAPKACIGAGTGLGEAFLTYNGEEYDVWACEGGHTDFGPRDDKEFKLMSYIKKAESVPRVSVERVVSGTGIPRIYEFFANEYPEEVEPEITARMKVEDKGKVITEYAKNQSSGLCKRTLETFVSAYGAEAGNLALKTLCRGGLYIAGGIAPKIMFAILENHNFYSNFVAKGRMEAVLSRIPVFVVLNSQVGMLGAKVICRRLLRKQGFQPKGQGEFYAESVPKTTFSDLMEDPDIQSAVINVQNAKARAMYGDKIHTLDVTPRNYSAAGELRSPLSPSSSHIPFLRLPNRGRSEAVHARDDKQITKTLIKASIIGGVISSAIIAGVGLIVAQLLSARKQPAPATLPNTRLF